jgi:hypothetical protein
MAEILYNTHDLCIISNSGYQAQACLQETETTEVNEVIHGQLLIHVHSALELADGN